MHLTTIIPCVNYSDFLALTLPAAKKASDCLCIVTSPEDKQTITFCAKHEVACLVTGLWRSDKAVFNKGAAMGATIAHISKYIQIEWLLTLDADTSLPMNAKEQLEKQQLQPHELYTCRRRMCFTPEMYKEYVLGGKIPDIEFSAQHKTIAAEGYFQLWNQHIKPVSIPHSFDASRYDRKLAYLWPASDRKVIPSTDLYVVHLGQKMQNWRGRRTPRWSAYPSIDFTI